MARVSVLIPLYNGVEFLEEAILSVMAQTCKDWEMIIGINGHPEGSSVEVQANDIVTRHNADGMFDVRVIYYDTKGKSETLNTMVTDARHDHIALLDADDVWLPRKLEKQMPFLQQYDVVGTQCIYFGDKTDVPRIPFGDISGHNIFNFNPVINSSSIIRKDLAYWDKNETRGIEDYDLWFKLFYEKKRFYNHNEVLCKHRIHKASSFNNSNYNYVDELKQKWRGIFNQ